MVRIRREGLAQRAVVWASGAQCNAAARAQERQSDPRENKSAKVRNDAGAAHRTGHPCSLKITEEGHHASQACSYAKPEHHYPCETRAFPSAMTDGGRSQTGRRLNKHIGRTGWVCKAERRQTNAKVDRSGKTGELVGTGYLGEGHRNTEEAPPV